jgi:D-alanyl-D-alanine carboxypeptidase (penicillin-binding protein 5/6)
MLAVVAGLLLSSVAYSQQVIIPAPPQLAATAYLLIDADTGKILVEHNSDQKIPPASLTKMMTSYLVSSEISRGSIKENDLVDVSVKAWRMGGSKMFIREGTRVSVKDLLNGVIIQSGNDASVALAEFVAGSESAFVDVMNQQAALLGMNQTLYKNATGWPAEGHITTARDLSLLARALINDHPEHYRLYSEKYFKYNGINQPNRNKLLFRDKSVDGIKTGHTDEAGFCLVSSAKQDGMRLIAVVMGTRSESARAAESQKLLTYGFRFYQTHELYSAGEVLNTARVWSGRSDQVKLGLMQEVLLTIPRGSEKEITANVLVDDTIRAPIKVGDELGQLEVRLQGELLLEKPLIALNSVEQAGFFSRMWDSIALFFANLFK